MPVPWMKAPKGCQLIARAALVVSETGSAFNETQTPTVWSTHSSFSGSVRIHHTISATVIRKRILPFHYTQVPGT